MTKFKKLMIASLILMLGLSSFAYADEVNTTETTTSYATNSETFTNEESANSANNSIDYSSMQKGDVFLHDTKVSVDNIISGNVFILANDVTINNVIDGNVFICADNVTVTSNAYVYSDMYIVAKTVNVAGYIYDLYSASNTLTLDQSGYIIRDLNAGCDTFNLNGYVRRNVNAHCNSIIVNADTAKVTGDLNYYSENEVTLPEGVVAGSFNFTKETNSSQVSAAVNSAARTFLAIASFVYSLVLILILILAMPKFSAKTKELILSKFWILLGIGILGLFLIPIISVILFTTLIGLWLGVALLCVYFILMSFATAIVSVALGQIVSAKLNKNTKLMNILFSVIIAIVILLLGNVKFIRGIVNLVVLCLGFGIVLYLIFNSKKKVEEPKKEN